MTRSHAHRSLWPLTVLATLGATLAVQGCSGRVQGDPDCGNNSSCGGSGGAAGSKGEAGGVAAAGKAGADSVTPNACQNNLKDSDESDVDCGGTSQCDRCTANGRCKSNADCETEFCQDKVCKEPTCVDGVKNQDETGVDCGGGCSSCDQGAVCSTNDDCAGHYCVKGVCGDHCRSGVRESDETDKDCGGATCGACADGGRCVGAADCLSRVCSKNICQTATCSDKITNQDESDIDCGGICSASKPCAIGARCNTPADCASWLCSAAGKCLADVVIPPADVIDDFEDGDLLLPVNPALGGRVGNWYAYGDGTGVSSFDVSAIKRGASSVNGLYTKGKGFMSWGSGVGVDLSHSADSKATYDASAYTGITFWARAESATKMTVALPDVDTDPAGKLCATCDHHYNKLVEIGTEWQRYTVAFSELILEAGTVPMPAAFKPSGLVSVRIVFAPNQSYEIYLDDLAFVMN
ncbi:MAG TPA: hypothetical protein VJV79_16290 [Polyangiaceae bacterium]|nr:hypothetical protein [Polyangiaceae bacterium]